MVNLTDPIFHDEEAARRHFEALRWPDGPVCPHCGVVGNAIELKGKSTRPGVYKCKECRKPFTVTVGTVYERSPYSAQQVAARDAPDLRQQEGYDRASALAHARLRHLPDGMVHGHRIREAMRESHMPEPMGGEGKFVEADETYVGGKAQEPRLCEDAPVARKRSCRWSSAAARCARTMSPDVTRNDAEADPGRGDRQGHAFPDGSKPGLYRHRRRALRAMRRSTTRSRNTCGATRTRTRSKATSRS